MNVKADGGSKTQTGPRYVYNLDNIVNEMIHSENYLTKTVYIQLENINMFQSSAAALLQPNRSFDIFVTNMAIEDNHIAPSTSL